MPQNFNLVTFIDKAIRASSHRYHHSSTLHKQTGQQFLQFHMLDGCVNGLSVKL